jgi:hypothetical protein
MIKQFAGALALLVSSVAPAVAQGDFGLVGPWRTQIDIPGRPAGSIYGVMNVSFDGTMHYSDTSQVVPQKVGPGISDFAFTTPSLGAWQKTQSGYALTHVELLANPNSSLFGVCTTDFAIQLTGNGAEFSGTATFTCVDAGGRSGGPPETAPISGKRIVVNQAR